jgi:uncharacterized protein (TIGR03437 family)
MLSSVIRRFPVVLLVAAVVPQLPAAPTITSVANAASNIGFNSPIAQGAIFVLKGSGLGPDKIAVAPAPFQSTSLSDTKVTVTAGAISLDAPIYYTSATQVAALLPSGIPAGGANFTVTYNGQGSSPVGHGTAPSNVGIFTIDSTGQGPGIVTFPDYSLVSASKASNCGGPNTACGAANPGDTLILWATGLGPVFGDEAGGAGLGQAMPNVPLKLWLGGIQAPVVYQGRSGCCVGEDQIVFTVPNNVLTGCAVPLVVQIGEVTNTISNTVVMPVAKGSRNCTTTNPVMANVQAAVGGSFTFGSIELDKELNDNGNGFQDRAVFEFYKFPAPSPSVQPFFVSWIDDLPAGSCFVSGSLNGGGDPPLLDPAPLNAGTSFTVTGPGGSVPVTTKAGNSAGTLSAAGTFLVPGAYTVAGTGGADIGALSATITFPATPTLVSPGNGAAVTRSNGMTVSWTGGGSNASVQISIASALDNTFKAGLRATCKAPAGPGTFTIPPYVLLALPAGNFAGFVLAPETASAGFTAPGLTFGLLQAYHNGTGFGYGAGAGSFALR